MTAIARSAPHRIAFGRQCGSTFLRGLPHSGSTRFLLKEPVPQLAAMRYGRSPPTKSHRRSPATTHTVSARVGLS